MMNLSFVDWPEINMLYLLQVVSPCSLLAITVNLETLICLIYIGLFATCSHFWSTPSHVCSG